MRERRRTYSAKAVDIKSMSVSRLITMYQYGMYVYDTSYISNSFNYSVRVGNAMLSYDYSGTTLDIDITTIRGEYYIGNLATIRHSSVGLDEGGNTCNDLNDGVFNVSMSLTDGSYIYGGAFKITTYMDDHGISYEDRYFYNESSNSYSTNQVTGVTLSKTDSSSGALDSASSQDFLSYLTISTNANATSSISRTCIANLYPSMTKLTYEYTTKGSPEVKTISESVATAKSINIYLTYNITNNSSFS